MPWPAFLPALIGLLAAPVCRTLARRIGLIDRPREDRFHVSATPKLGGLVLVVALLPVTPWLLARDALAAPFLCGFAFCFSMGLVDDLRRLPPRAKLVGQILPAALAAAWLLRLLPVRAPWLAGAPDAALFLFGTVWLVGFQNALNLLDNMDGISGGVSAIALSVLASHASPGLGRETALAASWSTVGFLPFNVTRPAKLFLGDAGALPLGFAVGFASLAAMILAPTWLAAGAVGLAVLVPVLDTTVVTVTRMREGRKISVGGRDHTTHRLYRRLGSVPATRRFFWAGALVLGAASLVVRAVSPAAGWPLVAVTVGLVATLGVLLARMPVPAEGE